MNKHKYMFHDSSSLPQRYSLFDCFKWNRAKFIGKLLIPFLNICCLYHHADKLYYWMHERIIMKNNKVCNCDLIRDTAYYCKQGTKLKINACPYKELFEQNVLWLDL